MDLIIMGAGPAGLFAALKAAENNEDKNILILEKNQTAGKKLLITGSGQCNITHSGKIDHFFDHYGDNYLFLMGALYSFDNYQLLNFFKERGLNFRTAKGGKIFPESNKAKDILNLLLDESKRRKIKISYNNAVKEVHYNYDRKIFEIKTTKKTYKSKYFLIAAGGKSFPKTGSTGDGFKLAQKLGHNIIEPRPALAPVIIKNYKFKMLSGISLKSKEISLWRNEQLIKNWQGDLLFTHQGLSGPGIINYSRYFSSGDLIKIKLLNYSKEELENQIIKRVTREGRLNLINLLIKFPLAQRLIEKILDNADIDGSKNAAHLTKKERKKIVELISNLEFEIKKVANYNQSMVTSGGIDLKEINPQTMGSNLINGLFAAGEVLDIDGHTGGYNLQSAFSTAYLAGSKLSSLLYNS